MRLVAIHTAGGVRIETLPLRQKDVEVVAKILLLADVGMALQAIPIGNFACQGGWLGVMVRNEGK